MLVSILYLILRRLLGLVACRDCEAVEIENAVRVTSPSFADTSPGLGTIGVTGCSWRPQLAERLQNLPQPELRALFDSLQLQIAFQP